MIKDDQHIIKEGSGILTNLGIFAISGLLIWYDPNILLGTLSDDDLIANVPDRIGGVGLRTISTSAQPIFKTNIINGNPVIRIDPGKVTATRSGVISNFMNNRIVEFFTVVRIDLVSPPTNFIQINHLRATTQPTISQRINSAPRFAVNTVNDLGVGNQLTVTSNNIPLSSTHIYYMRLDFTVPGTVTRGLEIVDYAPYIESTIAGDYNFTSGHTLRVGATGNDRTIDLGDNIIFSRSAILNPTEKSVVVNYLKSKYNI